MTIRKMIPLFLTLTILAASSACTAESAKQTADPASQTQVLSSQTTEQEEEPAKETQTEYGTIVLNEGDTIEGGTFTATEDDESAVEANGETEASMTGSVIQKTGGTASSADKSSFEGLNAAVRVSDHAKLTLDNVTVLATAENATGVFAYDGGTVSIRDSVVDVSGGGSGGVQVAGGGTLYGENLTVTSASKAAIRSDRGGGTMVLDGGTYTSTGSNGCPAIYSTADITVKNATCISENSRAVIIEGKNAVTLIDTDLKGNDQSSKEGSVHANVLLYQSASGDASEGTSVFSMTGGSMICESGAMFYCTNTSARILLENAALTLSDEKTLLIVSEGRWGKDGKNGGSCAMSCLEQELEGTIIVDEISSLDLSLESSTFEGCINPEGAAGNVTVTMSADSEWILTEDTYISSFSGDLSQVTANGYHLYVNGVLAL